MKPLCYGRVNRYTATFALLNNQGSPMNSLAVHFAKNARKAFVQAMFAKTK
jgi:hypothetical protein